MDLGLSSIIVAALTLLGVVYTASVQRRQGTKVTETHKHVTENSHSNEVPTLPDRLHDVREDVADLRAELSNELTGIWKALADIARALPPGTLPPQRRTSEVPRGPHHP